MNRIIDYPIINHFTDNDLYTFTCQYYVLQTYPRAEVEYTFFDRDRKKYPKGFAEELRQQIEYMKNVIITDEEIRFMEEKCYFLPKWYFTFLKGYRFNPNEVFIDQDEEGYLSIKIVGKWYSTIMWEMPILSIISELTHIFNEDYKEYNYLNEYKKSLQKAENALKNGLFIADMGTRRRFSFRHHDAVIGAFNEVQNKLKDSVNGKFTGTSNVFLAHKYNLTPIGTMSHQIISFEECVSGVFECNYNVMKKFSDVYDGDNGIYLYDCFGDKVFFNNLSKRMAMMYKGLRVDSGNEQDQVEKIIAKYKSLGIDPASKQVIFSNGLTIDKAIQIHNMIDKRVQDSYGIGTYLTCDINNVKPLNIVVKLTKCRITETREWHDCVKLSCDKGKTLGNIDKCNYLLSSIN